MNIRKNIDYSAMFAALDAALNAELPQMKLCCELGRIVCSRSEKGAAVAAAEYLHSRFPDASGFSPRNLRRMREFYRMYEDTPELLALAMEISWTQNVVILEADMEPDERRWYLRAAGRFGWSKAELQRKIDSDAHLEIQLDELEVPCYTESAIVMSWSVRSMIRILFLCHGNICRSPMAEFIMKDLVKKAGLEQNIQIESAATSTEEIGNPVYPPARRKLSEHGIDCSGKRARQLLNSDYEKYDLLIGMDRANLRSMYRICGGGDFAGKMHLLMDFTNRPGEVADPWYTDDFDTTWRDVEEGCRGLLQKIISKEVQTSGQAGCQGSGN